MQARPDYSEANPDDVEPYGMDFAPNLAAGETISSAAVDLTIISGCGCGADPANHIEGQPGVVGTQVSQVIANLIGETEYCLAFTITTTFGNTLCAYAHVYCRTPSKS